MTDAKKADEKKDEAPVPEKKQRPNMEFELHQVGSVLCGRILYQHPGVVTHVNTNGMSARVGTRTVQMTMSGDGPLLGGSGGTVLQARNASYPQNDFRWFTFAYPSEEAASEAAACMLKMLESINGVPMAKQEKSSKAASIRRIA